MIRRLYSLAATLKRYRSLIHSPVQAALFFGRGRYSECDFHYGGLKFTSRKTDLCGVREVLLEQEYRDIIPLIASVDRPVVYDLGANIGTFSIFVLSSKPDAKIISVEASGDTFDVLHRNQQANPACDWQCVHGAIWSSEGTVSISHSSASTGNKITQDAGDEQAPSLTLQTLTSRLAHGPIDLMKMDIEGAEIEAIRASQAVFEQVRYLIIEIHSDRLDEQEAAGLLSELYPFMYRISGRASSKPLVLCSRKQLDLAAYEPGAA